MFSFFHYRGVASLEFIAIAIPLFLLGLGGVEFAHWYSTRHMLNHALMLAARQASLKHAHPDSIEQSFEKALNPLFAQTPNPTLYRQKYLLQTQTNLQTAAWRIRVLSPKSSHFIDFHRDDLEIAQQTGLASIDNNYQKEQDARLGIGTVSQETIFNANTLSLSLSFPYQPIVPGMGLLFRQISDFFSDNYDKNIASHGYLPIQAQLSVMMQSHPVQWQTPSHGKIIYDSTTRSISSHQEKQPCTGIWCLKKTTDLTHHNKKSYPSPPNKSHPSTTTIPNPSRLPKSDSPTPPNPINPPTLPLPQGANFTTADSLSSDKKHPLCDISLCCKNY